MILYFEKSLIHRKLFAVSGNLEEFYFVQAAKRKD